jgi:hypothetical protein
MKMKKFSLTIINTTHPQKSQHLSFENRDDLQNHLTNFIVEGESVEDYISQADGCKVVDFYDWEEPTILVIYD